MIHAGEIVRGEGAAMREHELQVREALEDAVEDQIVDTGRRIERVADDVEEVMRRETLAREGRRMDEHRHIQLLHRRPERVETRRRKFLILADAGTDLDAAETELVDAALQFLDGKIGVLKRHLAEADMALGGLLHRLNDAVIDDLRGLVAEILVDVVIELLRVTAHRRDVDDHAVHVGQAQLHIRQIGKPVGMMFLVLRERGGVGIHIAGMGLVGGNMRLDEIVGCRDAKMDVEVDGRRLRPLLLGRMRAARRRVVGAHRDVVGSH
jgi:hypothetical protein